MKKALCVLTLLCAVSGIASALDKGKLENHLRSVKSLDPRLTVEIGEAQPSKYGNLLMVPVKIGQTQQLIFITPDEKEYIFGEVFDLTVDLDQARLDKIDLTNAHSKGSSKAPVKVVEYTDLQCPYCSRAHAAMEQELYKNYTKDQVQWVFKHFPLSMHKWAMPAAMATECAALQKKDAFWEMAHLFFENAGRLSEETAKLKGDEFDAAVKQKAEEYAKSLKLNMSKFSNCYANNETLKKVSDDMEEGRAIGVGSTPTIFINGRMQRGFREFSTIKALIDEKLAEAKK